MDREQLLSGIPIQATLWFVTPSAFSEISMMSYGVYAKGRAIVLLSIETCLLDFLSSTPSFPQFVKYWCGEFMEGVISFTRF